MMLRSSFSLKPASGSGPSSLLGTCLQCEQLVLEEFPNSWRVSRQGCLRTDHPRWKWWHGGLLGRTELPIPRYLSETNFTLELSLRPVGCMSARIELTLSRIGRRTIWFTWKGLRYIKMLFSGQDGNSGWHMICLTSGSLTPSQAVARMMCAILLTWILASAFAVPWQTPTNPPADGKHTITVNFSYDFSETPSCSKQIKKACIVQFNVYDISAGAKSPTKLFSVLAPPGETKPAHRISGKSPRLLLEPGKHQLAVTAQVSDGKESKVDATST